MFCRCRVFVETVQNGLEQMRRARADTVPVGSPATASLPEMEDKPPWAVSRRPAEQESKASFLFGVCLERALPFCFVSCWEEQRFRGRLWGPAAHPLRLAVAWVNAPPPVGVSSGRREGRIARASVMMGLAGQRGEAWLGNTASGAHGSAGDCPSWAPGGLTPGTPLPHPREAVAASPGDAGTGRGRGPASSVVVICSGRV